LEVLFPQNGPIERSQSHVDPGKVDSFSIIYISSKAIAWVFDHLIIIIITIIIVIYQIGSWGGLRKKKKHLRSEAQVDREVWRGYECITIWRIRVAPENGSFCLFGCERETRVQSGQSFCRAVCVCVWLSIHMPALVSWIGDWINEEKDSENEL